MFRPSQNYTIYPVQTHITLLNLSVPNPGVTAVFNINEYSKYSTYVYEPIGQNLVPTTQPLNGINPNTNHIKVAGISVMAELAGKI